MKIEPLFRLLSGFLSVGKHNANVERIENAFDNTLSRDGSSPNSMLAELDMGLNRVINVGEPQDLTDAVRLQDLQEAVVGDFTVSADWADVTGKPTEFPPEDHTHVAADVTDLAEFVEDKIGTKLVAGTGMTVTYNDSTGETTLEATTAGGADWNTLANKPTEFTPSSHTHAQSDVTGLVSALSGKANSTHTHLLADITDFAASSASTTLPNFVDVFGGNPDGVTSNDTAFTNAEASSYERIWLPEGNYYTTKANSFFNKWYTGPGKIMITSGTSALPGKKRLVSNPSFGSVVSEYGEGGDISFADAQYEYIATGVRQRVLSGHLSNANYAYFQAGANSKFYRFFSQSGGSGTSAHLVATASAGATTADINSSSGLSVGNSIGFATNDGVPVGDIVTITNISVGGGTGGSDRITFTPSLANTYTFGGSDYAVPTYISGYATNPRVMKGMRTMNCHYFLTVDTSGEGDVYGFCVRAANSYTLKAGQTDFFEGSTVAAFGGDLLFTGDGQYGTPWEFAASDQGFDVAVINVHTYNRSNDTGARRVTWIHSLVKSEGTKPIDVAYSLHGKARVGLDFVPADFSSNSEAAIQLKTGQRIYFDSSASAGSAGIGTRARGFWGNLVGDSYITHGSDGSGEYIDTYVNNVRTLRQRSGSINTSLQVNVNNSINVTQQVGVSTGGSIRLNGVNGDTYIQFDGSNIYVVKNGGVVQTW